MADDITMELAHVELGLAAMESDIAINWIEIAKETGKHLNIRMRCSDPIQSYRVSLEIFADNGFGAKRHRQISKTAERLDQAVRRAIAEMVPAHKR